MQSGRDASPDSPILPLAARAFTQGVGTVFQFVGVGLFIGMVFVCCASSLLSKDAATHSDLRQIGWHLRSDTPDRPTYSAQLATTLTVTLGVFFGMALAGIGLGLQAQTRRAPMLAVLLCLIGCGFWIVQTLFFAMAGKSILLSLLCGGLSLLFLGLAGLSIAAFREMHRNPPPANLATLPADYKLPYSHLHADPPEIRLAAELEHRRQKLTVQQKELEMLEQKLKRHLKQNDE